MSMMAIKTEWDPRECLYDVFEVHLGIYVALFSTDWHHTAVDRL